MKIKNIIFATGLIVLFAACSEDTGLIGSSITSDGETPDIATDTFEVKSSTILADSLYARNSSFYLGSMIDQESGDRINSSFFTQFHTLESFSNNMVDIDSITSKDTNGNIIADSCKIRMYYDNIQGDSITHSVIRVYEMSRGKLLSEKDKYYTNFDVKSNARGLLAEHERLDSDSVKTDIMLTEKYISQDKDGKDEKTYSNFGTYLLRMMYAHPKDFDNSLTMAKKYLPGMYVTENVGKDGKWRVSECYNIQIIPYFTYQNTDTTTTVGGYVLPGTPEVLQFAHIEHNKEVLKPLTKDPNYDYIKTPSGLFTELELPVDSIFIGHEKDEVNSVKTTFTSLTDETSFDLPGTLLMLPKPMMNSFFEDPNTLIKDMYAEEIEESATSNYLDDYVSSCSATVSNQTYTFSNFVDLCKYMYKKNKEKPGENWNKVVLIPITTTTNSSSEVITVAHNMGYTTARILKKNEDGTNAFRLSVFYTRHQ